MLKNYLIVALRNLLRNKAFSIINVVGLAIGLACSILIFLWVQDEMSYDRFHSDEERLCRIVQDIVFEDKVTWAISQGPLGPSLVEDFPEIVAFNRVTWMYGHFYKDENQHRLLGRMVDSSFFDLFSLPLLEGNPSTALVDPHSIVITESTAEEMFGDEDPMGQIINMDKEFDFRISGIMVDPPSNTIFSDLRYLIPFHFADELGYNTGTWGNSGYYTFLKLDAGVRVEDISAKIADYLEDKPTIEEYATLRLQPMHEVWLHSPGFDFDMDLGDIRYVYIFSIIAGFILVIACVNFMNLTTARASRRMREISIRKISGADKHQLIIQILLEFLMLVLLATVLAVIMVELIRPYFNQLSGKDLKMEYSSALFLGNILGIIIVSVLLSGIYPSLVISGFSPLSILRGNRIAGGRSSLFRKILVVFQFSISVILIAATLVVQRQYEYLRSKDLGYDRENLISIPKWEGFYDHYPAVRQRLLEHPSVIGVTSVARSLTQTYSYSNSLWSWEGKGDDEEILIRAAFVDYDYFKTLGLKILEGRSFSRDHASDTVSSVVINETAARIMGMTDPVGQMLITSEANYIIIGVVMDYHYRSLHSKIEPLVIMLRPNFCRYLIARISPSDEEKNTNTKQTLEYIDELWKEYVKDSEFTYRFADDIIDREYYSEKRIQKISRSFSCLAIIVSCLGLFGLSLFTVETRTKEIGIRKVNGASKMKVMLLLTTDYTKWVMLSFLIAFPVSWLIMSKWLQSFPYHISLTPGVFILAGLLALIISWLTVLYQAWSTSAKNPVESLRYE